MSICLSFKYVNPFGIIPRLLQFCLAKGRVCMSGSSPCQALPTWQQRALLVPLSAVNTCDSRSLTELRLDLFVEETTVLLTGIF